jgi:hypothetical protein
MITEIVLFRLPEGMTREEATAKLKASVPIWQAEPALASKAYLFDADTRQAGGVYLWENIEAAKKAHGPEFQKRIRATYGSDPEFRYFETPILIDNRKGLVEAE